ncbi:MAG: hypothetical protein JWP25_973 [Bradyrhizobium sp.]|jgi:hypothetical protein|nr:hypothetical protein [Bradyrhizobium sp.]
MFVFRRPAAAGRSRLHALRALYRNFFHENSNEERGLRLLKQWLSPRQLIQFEGDLYFDVIGSDSGATYRIHYGTSMNVHQINGQGDPVAGWCFVPNGYLVAGDVMLAQKIALETNEDKTLAIANRFSPSQAILRANRHPF